MKIHGGSSPGVKTFPPIYSYNFFLNPAKKHFMRFLVKITLPHEPFNSLVRNGSAEKKMQPILAETKPEAAYFTAVEANAQLI